MFEKLDDFISSKQSYPHYWNYYETAAQCPSNRETGKRTDRVASAKTHTKNVNSLEIFQNVKKNSNRMRLGDWAVILKGQILDFGNESIIVKCKLAEIKMNLSKILFSINNKWSESKMFINCPFFQRDHSKNLWSYSIR